MEFKGTKGTWTINPKQFDFETDIYCGTTRIAEVKHYNHGDNDWTRFDPTVEVGKANAQLISKAPEMLEMLQRIISLESIICMGGAVAEQWQGEAEALNTMMNDAKQLIKEATTINQ